MIKKLSDNQERILMFFLLGATQRELAKIFDVHPQVMHYAVTEILVRWMRNIKLPPRTSGESQHGYVLRVRHYLGLQLIVQQLSPGRVPQGFLVPRGSRGPQ